MPNDPRSSTHDPRSRLDSKRVISVHLRDVCVKISLIADSASKFNRNRQVGTAPPVQLTQVLRPLL